MLPPTSGLGDSGPEIDPEVSLLLVEMTGGLTGSSGLNVSKSKGDFKLKPVGTEGPLLWLLLVLPAAPKSCRLLGSSRDSLNEDGGVGL